MHKSAWSLTPRRMASTSTANLDGADTSGTDSNSSLNASTSDSDSTSEQDSDPGDMMGHGHGHSHGHGHGHSPRTLSLHAARTIKYANLSMIHALRIYLSSI